MKKEEIKNIERAEGNFHMIAEGQKDILGRRIYFLDNLRTYMIFLVVSLHAALVYEEGGFAAAWWIVDDPSTNGLIDILILILDIFVMSAIFFISGYFVPSSIENKSGWSFVRSKFRRLIIPWVIATLTLQPLYKIIFLYSRNLPRENWTTYFHWSNGIWNESWLWFLPVIFLFDVLYLFFSKSNIKKPNISLKGAVFSIFIIGFIYSFCMDIFGVQGWTHSILIDFQNERILIYFMIFLLGSLCYKLKIFESKPRNKKMFIALNGSLWIPVFIYLIFLIYPYLKQGNHIFSENFDSLIIWLNFHLSLLAVLYLLIYAFRNYFNKPGKIRKELNRNSYGVYIIHVAVLGGMALIMLGLPIPSLLKYLILTVSTWTASNLIVYLYRSSIKSKNLLRAVKLQ